MKKEINENFIILYFLGIIFITAGHCLNGGFSLFYEFFPPYAFHLGLFMFASGYFYNPDNLQNIKNYIIKKVKKLIVPLYLYNIFYMILIIVLKKFGFFPQCKATLNSLIIQPLINGHQFLFNLGSWFIIPLFSAHLINILIRKIFNHYGIKINEFAYLTLSLLAGILGVYFAYYSYSNPNEFQYLTNINIGFWYSKVGFQFGLQLFIVRILYLFPFYSLGILYKKYEKFDKINSFVYFSIIILIILIIIFKFGSTPTYTPSLSHDFSSNPFLPFIVGFLGIAFWLRIAKILTPALKNSKIVNLIANNTYSIMVNQFLGFMILKGIFALIHKFSPYCTGFNMQQFKTNIFYYYLPHNLSQMAVLYLAFGLFLPLIVNFCNKKHQH